MSYGQIVIGKLTFEISQVIFRGGKMILYAVAILPKNKHIPEDGVVSFVLYGDDGSRVMVGVLEGSDFAYAHRWIRDGNCYLELPLRFGDVFTNVRIP